jgi:hypothetical protein
LGGREARGLFKVAMRNTSTRTTKARNKKTAAALIGERTPLSKDR